MSALTSVLWVEDSAGSRVQEPDGTGNYLPETVIIGDGLVATQTNNGGICEIRIDAPAVDSNVAVVDIPQFTTTNSSNHDTLIYTFSGKAGAEIVVHARWVMSTGNGSACALHGAIEYNGSDDATSYETPQMIPAGMSAAFHFSGPRVYLRVNGIECFTMKWKAEAEIRTILW